MARGGKRQGAGRKAYPRPEAVKADRTFAARLIEAMGREEKPSDTGEIKAWRDLWFAADLRVRLDTRKYWYDKRDGKAVHTVNHLHDKPLELNVTHTLSERMKIALEKAEARVRNR